MFSPKKIPREFTDINYEELVDKMICVTFDYAYDDIPLGGMDTNCFDGRISNACSAVDIFFKS